MGRWHLMAETHFWIVQKHNFSLFSLVNLLLIFEGYSYEVWIAILFYLVVMSTV